MRNRNAMEIWLLVDALEKYERLKAAHETLQILDGIEYLNHNDWIFAVQQLEREQKVLQRQIKCLCEDMEV